MLDLESALEVVGELLKFLENFSLKVDAMEIGWLLERGILSEMRLLDPYLNVPGEPLQQPHWKGFNLIWKSHVSVKAQITYCRLTLDRLPTKINLNKR